jgi:hypothetical protein
VGRLGQPAQGRRDQRDPDRGGPARAGAGPPRRGPGGLTAERYLEVVLRLARIAPDLVESYTGPPELAARIDAEPPPEPAALAAEAGALREELAGDRWIAAQLAGIEAACEVLAGARIPYRRLVERCYGVTPAEVPEDVFAAAHERLAAALPGRGPLRDRYARWLETQLVPPRLVEPALAALTAELRGRTRERFALPQGERVEIESVGGKPWSGFATYEGGLRSRISINTDLPLHGFRLLELVAHEIYPGHHTEHVLKDGLEGHAAYVYPTPQALVSEGLAMHALDALLGEEADRVAAACLRPLGIAYDEQTAAAALDARMQFTTVRTNLAIRLDEGRIDVDSARAYARRWLVESDAYVDELVDGLRSNPWPPYESCYVEGHVLCREFAGRYGFRRLLTERLTTSDLVRRRTIG